MVPLGTTHVTILVSYTSTKINVPCTALTCIETVARKLMFSKIAVSFEHMKV